MSNAVQKIALGVGIGKAAVGLYNAFTKGAEKPWKNKPQVTFTGKKDFRAKLILKNPDSIFTGIMATEEGGIGYLKRTGGILFPFTPTISFETNAQYSNMNPLQSNFTIYAYKNSLVGAMNLSAKFTVQNDNDAGFYLGVLHLLRTLTKMKVGSEPDAGAPPPICRLFAYGPYMLENVPVVISSFRTELTDTVDYYKIDPVNELNHPYFGDNFVPTYSTIQMTLLPVYTRSEQLAYRTDQFVSGDLLGKGYL